MVGDTKMESYTYQNQNQNQNQNQRIPFGKHTRPKAAALVIELGLP